MGLNGTPPARGGFVRSETQEQVIQDLEALTESPGPGSEIDYEALYVPAVVLVSAINHIRLGGFWATGLLPIATNALGEALGPILEARGDRETTIRDMALRMGVVIQEESEMPAASESPIATDTPQ